LAGHHGRPNIKKKKKGRPIKKGQNKTNQHQIIVDNPNRGVPACKSNKKAGVKKQEGRNKREKKRGKVSKNKGKGDRARNEKTRKTKKAL